MPLEDGTYTITNVETGQMFDLRGGDIQPGNNIIGYRNNGGANQKWVLENGNGYVTLRSLLSELANVATVAHHQGAKVVIKENAEHLLLVPHGSAYRIEVLNQALLFRLPNGNDNTDVQLDPVGLGNDVWEFNELDTK